MPEHSAEFLRGRREGLRALKDRIGGQRSTMLATWGSFTAADVETIINDELALLDAAEAREAGTPTAADLAVADELDLLAEHIGEYVPKDDARDEIRRICKDRAADLRRGEAATPPPPT